MSFSIQPNEKNKQATQHEPGARAAWGMITGATLGVIVGLFVGKALILGLIIGSTGWIVGGLIDRSRT